MDFIAGFTMQCLLCLMCVIICGSVRVLVTFSACFGVFLFNGGSSDSFVCLRKSLVNLNSERKQTRARMSLKVAIEGR